METHQYADGGWCTFHRPCFFGFPHGLWGSLETTFALGHQSSNGVGSLPLVVPWSEWWRGTTGPNHCSLLTNVVAEQIVDS